MRMIKTGDRCDNRAEYRTVKSSILLQEYTPR